MNRAEKLLFGGGRSGAMAERPTNQSPPKHTRLAASDVAMHRPLSRPAGCNLCTTPRIHERKRCTHAPPQSTPSGPGADGSTRGPGQKPKLQKRPPPGKKHRTAFRCCDRAPTATNKRPQHRSEEHTPELQSLR